MNHTAYKLYLSFFLFLSWTTDAQTNNIISLPNDYRGIELGMHISNVKELLKKDPSFDYSGDPHISLSDNPNESLIEAGGSLFITRSLFQFRDDNLTAIVLELSQQNLDWFTIYSVLENRYGSPLVINPEKAWWESDSTRLALERPLTVKYLDIDIFGSAKNSATDRKAWREMARNEFLNAF